MHKILFPVVKNLGIPALFTSVIGIGFVGAASNPAMAVSFCPQIGTLTNTGCNTLITFNPDGSISTTIPNPIPFDGIEDNLVGILNNSSLTISSINLTGNNIFGFDGDGLSSYGLSFGPSGYEGPNNTFTIVDANNGTVNFTTPLAPGQNAYFALEEAPTLSLVVSPGASVPEPFTIIGTLVGGTAALRLRKKLKSITKA